MRGIAGKVAAVAGGATGQGAATALRLAEAGARVVVGDLDGTGAEESAAAIRSAGGTATAVPLDLRDDASVRAFFSAAVETYGGVDLLHNNAADVSDQTLSRDTDVLDTPPDVWDTALQTNFLGYVRTIREVLPIMLARGGGRIVNMSSAGVFTAQPQRVAYISSKAAINALTRHVAVRWGREGIRCNALMPGFILSPGVRRRFSDAEIEEVSATTSVGRVGDPADTAGVVAFLLSGEADFVNGQVWTVDGGVLLRD